MTQYSFTLYVAGGSDLSLRAIANFERLVQSRLAKRCSLTTVDVVKEPRRAREARVLATPLLVREDPLPVIKILGDLSHEDKVISQLGLGILADNSQAGESA